MTPLFLDTSVLISVLRGKQLTVHDEIVTQARMGNVFYNGVVLTELLSGARGEKDVAQIENMLSGITYLALRYNDFRKAGSLRRELASTGLSMSTPDALIAIHTMEYSLKLVTLDAFFLKMPDDFHLDIEVPVSA